jgi:Divergent InlB B-repeat domain
MTTFGTYNSLAFSTGPSGYGSCLAPQHLEVYQIDIFTQGTNAINSSSLSTTAKNYALDVLTAIGYASGSFTAPVAEGTQTFTSGSASGTLTILQDDTTPPTGYCKTYDVSYTITVTEPVTVTVLTNPTSTGTVTGSGTYFIGNTPTISCNPTGTGYTFSYWSASPGTVVDIYNSTTTLSPLNGNLTVTAVLVPIVTLTPTPTPTPTLTTSTPTPTPTPTLNTLFPTIQVLVNGVAVTDNSTIVLDSGDTATITLNGYSSQNILQAVALDTSTTGTDPWTIGVIYKEFSPTVTSGSAVSAISSHSGPYTLYVRALASDNTPPSGHTSGYTTVRINWLQPGRLAIYSPWVVSLTNTPVWIESIYPISKGVTEYGVTWGDNGLNRVVYNGLPTAENFLLNTYNTPALGTTFYTVTANAINGVAAAARDLYRGNGLSGLYIKDTIPTYNINNYFDPITEVPTLPHSLDEVKIGSNEWAVSDVINASLTKLYNNFDYIRNISKVLNLDNKLDLIEWSAQFVPVTTPTPTPTPTPTRTPTPTPTRTSTPTPTPIPYAVNLQTNPGLQGTMYLDDAPVTYGISTPVAASSTHKIYVEPSGTFTFDTDLGWQDDTGSLINNKVNPAYTNAIVSNATFIARLKTPGQYTLTLASSPPQGGSYTGQGSYPVNNYPTIITASPATDYDFVHWINTDTSEVIMKPDMSGPAGTPFGFYMPAANLNITAVFNYNPPPAPTVYYVSLNVDPVGGGTINYGSGYGPTHDSGTGYYSGEHVVIDATNAYGYEFSHWDVTGGATSIDTSAPNQVNFNINGAGNVTVTGYFISTTITPTPTPTPTLTPTPTPTSTRTPTPTPTPTFTPTPTSTPTQTPTPTPTPTCPPYGYLISTYCQGTSLIGTYSDGNCTTYDNLITVNSTDCGYVPTPTPTPGGLTVTLSDTTISGVVTNNYCANALTSIINVTDVTGGSGDYSYSWVIDNGNINIIDANSSSTRFSAYVCCPTCGDQNQLGVATVTVTDNQSALVGRASVQIIISNLKFSGCVCA